MKLSRVHIVNRTEYILEKCRGKKVLDCGCANASPNADGVPRLHMATRKVASLVHGVDIDEKAIVEFVMASSCPSRRSRLTRGWETLRRCRMR